MATHYIKLVFDYIDDDYVLGMIVSFRNYTTGLRFLRELRATKAACNIIPTGPGPDYEQVLLYVDGAEVLQPKPSMTTEPEYIRQVIATITDFVKNAWTLTTLATAHRIQKARSSRVLFRDIPISSDNEFTLELVCFTRYTEEAWGAQGTAGWHLLGCREYMSPQAYDCRRALAPQATIALIRELLGDPDVACFDVIMSQIDAHVIRKNINDILRGFLELTVIKRERVPTNVEWLHKEKDRFLENPVRYVFDEDVAEHYSANRVTEMQDEMLELELALPTIVHPLQRTPSTQRKVMDFYQRYIFQQYIENSLDSEANVQL